MSVRGKQKRGKIQRKAAVYDEKKSFLIITNGKETEVQSRTRIAIDNSERLRKNYLEAFNLNLHLLNPYTSIDILVNRLLEN